MPEFAIIGGTGTMIKHPLWRAS